MDQRRVRLRASGQCSQTNQNNFKEFVKYRLKSRMQQLGLCDLQADLCDVNSYVVLCEGTSFARFRRASDFNVGVDVWTPYE